MQVTRKVLDDAAVHGLLQPGQPEALWKFIADVNVDTPQFKAAHILYYLGGMTAIGAMTLFMTLGWERYRGGGLLVIAAAYCILAGVLTEAFLKRKLAIPAGIAAVLGVVMVPLAVYGAQHALGFWPDGAPGRGYRDYHTWIDWRWLLMELATLAAGTFTLWRYRLPFLVMPLAVTLWYMSMDATAFLLGGNAAEFFSPQGKVVSTWFGVCMTVVAIWVDVRSRDDKDFAFWLYVFGVLTFWGGLTSMDSNSELGKFMYFAINIFLITLGAALSRRVFAVFGGIGVAVYLGHLSHTIFKDSMLFPVALTAIGLGIVAAGVWWQRNEVELGRKFRSVLPVPFRELLNERSAT
jgi:hypothetical protein